MFEATANPVTILATEHIQTKGAYSSTFGLKEKTMNEIPNNTPAMQIVNSMPARTDTFEMNGIITICVIAGRQRIIPVRDPLSSLCKARRGKKTGKVTMPTPIHIIEKKKTRTIKFATFYFSLEFSIRNTN